MPRPATRAEVVAAVRALPPGRTRFVGIDGFGGAGKTSLAERLADAVPDVTIVHGDDFASPAIAEWDWPRLQAQVLDPLRAGRPGRYQRWDWATDTGAEWHDVRPGGVVLVEGVSATRRELVVDWDLTIWVDAPPEVRLARALRRDGADRLATWRDRWIPEELAWAARDRPTDRVDLVVTGDGAPTAQDLGQSTLP